MVDVDSAIKIWNYTSDLARHLYEVLNSSHLNILNSMLFSLTNVYFHLIEVLTIISQEGLLDRHEILQFLLEMLEKMKITDDTVLKLVLVQILKVIVKYVFLC